MGSGSKNWDGMIQMWYNEVKSTSKSIVPKYAYVLHKRCTLLTPFNHQTRQNFGDRFSSATGHYTQVVWGATYKVGCGYTVCPSGGIYACNYGPAGNMLNAPMYKIGAPASACPTGTSPKDGLCG